MSAERGKAESTPPQAMPAAAAKAKERPAFGGGLLASSPPKNRPIGSTITSIVIHGLLIGFAIKMTMGAGVQKEEAKVEVVEMTQEMAPPPPPPPPPVDQPQAQIQGFQTLSVPDIVPATIPPPGDVVFKASDFTGQGVQGGGDMGQKKDEGATAVVAIGETPSFTPFTVAPQLKNRDDVSRALEREYPPLLRDAGVGGKIDVWVRISDKGVVEDVQIHTSSGHPALDEAAIKVGKVMQFTPAMNRDKQVPVWVSIPITFQVR